MPELNSAGSCVPTRILGDAGQRAAYDQLLALARREQEETAKQAAADKVHKVASGVMALAGISVVAVGGYNLFAQLTPNALTPAIAITEAVPAPAPIVATELAVGAVSVSAGPQETSGRPDIITSSVVPAAETAPGHGRPPLGHTPRHAPKFASTYIDRDIFPYPLRKFTDAFAELAGAKRFHRARPPSGHLTHASSRFKARDTQ